MHRFLKTGYTKSHPSLVMGPAVPREHDCVWANVTRSQDKKYSYSQQKDPTEQAWLLCDYKLCSFFLLTYSPFHPDPHDAVRWRYIHKLMFLLPQFCYVMGPVGTYLLAQWKGTKQLPGVSELTASWRIQATCTTGSEVFKLSEARWRSLYHTWISFILRQAIKYAFLKNP